MKILTPAEIIAHLKTLTIGELKSYEDYISTLRYKMQQVEHDKLKNL